jgi:hypothetical protein
MSKKKLIERIDIFFKLLLVLMFSVLLFLFAVIECNCFKSVGLLSLSIFVAFVLPINVLWPAGERCRCPGNIGPRKANWNIPIKDRYLILKKSLLISFIMLIVYLSSWIYMQQEVLGLILIIIFILIVISGLCIAVRNLRR